jgi:hypothetical protein
MLRGVSRGIFSGMGIADDPNVNDYYDKMCGFPIVYSPDEDPEVMEEMHIAVAELKNGGDGSDAEEVTGFKDSSKGETTSDDGDDDGWVDDDGDEEENVQGKQKRQK